MTLQCKNCQRYFSGEPEVVVEERFGKNRREREVEPETCPDCAEDQREEY